MTVASAAIAAHPAAGEEPEYHVEAHTSLRARPPQVLKHDEAFGVFDDDGDCGKQMNAADGVYFRDTRYLNRWELRFAGRRPMLLSSTLYDDNSALAVSATNPDIEGEIEKDTVAITRTKFIWDQCCYERIGLRNFDAKAHKVRLSLLFNADFKDLFEVRGMDRDNAPPVTRSADGDALVFTYCGHDGATRTTRILFDPPPALIANGAAQFHIELAARGTITLIVRVEFHEDTPGMNAASVPLLTAYRAKRRDAKARASGMATIRSSNDVFNETMCRSMSDICMLLSRTPDGLYPHAGIPWYSTVFGRDGLITAWLMLWVAPGIARGVLRHLAATQATTQNASADAQPGKILHEVRHCEMARTGEVPFARYYGTVDATPLFILLAGHYLRRSGDVETIRAIWPNIKAALVWCETFGDRDGDGFIEYFRETPSGLSNQGWKDSHDSIFHDNGDLARGPIALIEVQTYYYEAKLQASWLAEQLGEAALAEKLRSEASVLRTRIHEAFWSQDMQSYALALDGAKRPCHTKASNAGHALLTDVPPSECAQALAQGLMAPDMWSGWGIRTLSTASTRYNPMSYHNGSVWPHDNALIAAGFARHGMKNHAVKLFEGLYRAQAYQADMRLPELFCGFPKRRGRGPVSYPVSCSPQAWAAATPFALLGACLGLSIGHAERTITFSDPILPAFLREVYIEGLSVGGDRVDVRLARRDGDVALNVLGNAGKVRVIVAK